MSGCEPPIRFAPSLDHFRKCSIEGCQAHVYVPFGPPRCAPHGGPVDVPTITHDAFGGPPTSSSPVAVTSPLPRAPSA